MTAFSSPASKVEARPEGPGEWFRATPTVQGRQKDRKVTSFVGLRFTKGVRGHVNDLSTLSRAILERVFYDKKEDGGFGRPDVPDKEVVESRLAPFLRALSKVRTHVTPMTYEQFVASRGRKRAVYERALETFRVRGLSAHHWTVRAFVKFEKLVDKLLPCGAKKEPVPRVIQPRDPVYNLAVGVYISALEGVLYKDMAKVFGSVTVFKGMNAAQQGALMSKKWGRFSEPCGIGGDLSRMDQHCSAPVLGWEHRVYKRYFPYRRLARLLSKQLVNKGTGRCWDGNISYQVIGSRMSGDMNTGLGNCVIMCAAVYSALQGIDFELANNGDDIVIICETSDRDEVISRMLEFMPSIGFPITMEEPVYELEKLEFCQTQCVWNGVEWKMVRNPVNCLDKDNTSLKPIRNEREWNTLRKSVSQCGLALAGDMPLFKAFYAMLGRGAGDRVDLDSTESGFKILARGMNCADGVITPEARCSFFRAFNITPDEQVALEGQFDSATPTWRDPAESVIIPAGAVGMIMGCNA